MENDNNDIGGENMITINATMSQMIKIGHQGENKAVQVAFDLTPFQSAFSGGHPQLVVRRPGDHSGYPVALIVNGSQAIWIVSSSDTEKSGHGQCELQWFVGDTLAKSDKYNFLIYSSIPGDAEPPDVPSKAWFEKILSDIGDLSDLDTEAKENLVAAINEARQTGGGGAGGTNDHTKLSNRDAADQHPIAAITGLEAALDGKQPAGSYLTEESDPTVPAWAKADKKPSYTAQEVGADPSGTAAGLVSSHNTAEAAHNDIRLLISGLTDRLNALADSDDTTLDQLSEVVAYIKANRELIASISTDKVSVTDIVNDLVTNVANKPLSAAQGVALKALIDAITIPDKLPNPNALTFTGAVSGSYDGSKPLTVNVPSLTVDDSLTQSGQAADAAAVGEQLSSLSGKIDNLPSGGSGLTASEKTAMLTLFKAAAYTSDVRETITQLENLWGGSGGDSGGDSGGGEEENTYSVTNNLTNVANSNAATSVEAGGYYSATLSAETGYNISVNITMGGVDITDSVYTKDGTILITEVTGDIVITATAELATAPVLYQLSNTPRIVNADLHEDTGLTFGSDSANGYTKAWTICVDAVVSTRSKVLFGVNDSEANAKCLQFQTNGAGNGQIYINNNSFVQSPVNSEERHRFVITHAANADKTATVHIVTDGAVVSTVVSAVYGSFIHSGYAGNLNIGGKSAADFVGTINEFIIYDGILSDAHIAEFLGVA